MHSKYIYYKLNVSTTWERGRAEDVKQNENENEKLQYNTYLFSYLTVAYTYYVMTMHHISTNINNKQKMNKKKSLFKGWSILLIFVSFGNIVYHSQLSSYEIFLIQRQFRPFLHLVHLINLNRFQWKCTLHVCINGMRVERHLQYKQQQ